MWERDTEDSMKKKEMVGRSKIPVFQFCENVNSCQWQNRTFRLNSTVLKLKRQGKNKEAWRGEEETEVKIR